MSTETLPETDHALQVLTPELATISGDRLKQAVTQSAATMDNERYAASCRLQKAMDLVLSGAISLEEHGGPTVTSGSHSYQIDPHHGCTCRDAQHRSKWCKHAVAVELSKRTMMRLGNGNGNGNRSNGTGQAEVASVPPSLTHQESVASANTYVMLAGHQVQITIRAGCTAADVDGVIANMQRVLNQFPSVDQTTTNPPEGWREIHQVQMTKHTKNGQSW